MRFDQQINPARLEGFSRRFLVWGLFACAFLITFTRIHNGDIWWSLAEGRTIAATGALQVTNRFAYTFPNQPWNSAQWLFSLGAYALYQAAGVPGLILLKIALFLTLTALLLNRTGARLTGRHSRVFLLTLFVLAVRFRILERADLCSLLLFVLWLFLIDRFRSGHKTALRWLPVTALLWSNLHAGVVFGLGLLALAATEDGLTFLVRNRWNLRQLFASDFFRRYLLFGVLAVAATLINPQGAHWLVHATAHLNVGSIIELVEYLPPWHLGGTLTGYFLLAGLYLVLTGARLVKLCRLQAYDLIAPIFLIFSLRYNRLVPYFAAAAVLSCAESLVRLRPPSADRQTTAGRRVAWDLLGGILLILAPLFLFGRVPFLPLRNEFGLGVNGQRLPVRTVNFLEANPCPGPLYNQYFWGGYLAWRLPQQPVFIDGRVPAYPPDFIRAARRSRSTPAAFRSLDDSYRFRCLLFRADYLDWDLAAEYGDSCWVPVYWDNSAARIYVRRAEAPDYARDFGFEYYTPGFNSANYQRIKSDRDDFTRLLAEIRRHYRWTGEKDDRRLLALIEPEYRRQYGSVAK